MRSKGAGGKAVAPRAGPRWAGPIGTACLALALTCYAWVVLRGDAPAPAGPGQTSPGGASSDPLTGLGSAAGIGLLGAVAITAVCTAVPLARGWRAHLACASGGLYLAVASAAIGTWGLVLGVAAGGAAALALALTHVEVAEDELLLALHAGACGSALCLFSTWPRLAAGWPAFRGHLAAVAKLWS